MVPLTCRLLVVSASFIVPKSKRLEWRREWNSELWHRAETGASREDLLRRAWGVFRDAAWIRSVERKKHGVDYFRKPLRTEALFLASALVIALLTGAFRPPHLPYRDAASLVTFERNLSLMGAPDSFISPRLPAALKESRLFQDIALYRVNRQPVLSMRVSRNFFDMLGSQPMLGRTFREDDLTEVVILSYDVWRDRLRSDPKVIGKQAAIDGRMYTIVGVMPPEFWFALPASSFSRLSAFVPLPRAR